MGRSHARRAILATLTALAVGGLVALPALSVRLEPKALLPEAPAIDATEEALRERFGRPKGPLVLVRVHAPEVLATESLGAIDELTRALEAHDAVARVRSPTNLPLPVPLPPGAASERADDELDALLTLIEQRPEAFPNGLASVAEATGGPSSLGRPFDGGLAEGAAIVRRHRSLLGPLLGDEGRSALLLVHLREGIDWRPDLLAGPLDDAADLRPELTGAPVLEAALGESLAEEAPLPVALAMLGNALVLLLVMRSRRGVALPLGAGGISLSILLSIMALSGQPFTLLHTMLPPLLLTVAISDAIHIVFRYRANLRARRAELDGALGTESRRAVLWDTAKEMAGACLVTSATTAAGFGALILAHTPAVRALALWSVAGIAIAYVVTLLFVLAGLDGSEPKRRQGHAAARVAMAACRRPWPVLLLWLAIGVAGAAANGRIPHGSRLLAPFPADLPAAAVARAIDEHHGGSRRLELVVDDAETSRRVGAWLRDQPAVTRVTSADSLRAEVFGLLTPTEVAPPVDPRSRAALATLAGPLLEGWEASDGAQRLEVALRDVPAETIVALVERLEAQAPVAVAGEAARTSMAVATIQSDLARTFAFALVTVLLIVGLLLRDLRLGAIALLPNLLPLTAGLGWMALRGLTLDASTAMVFAASLGLAVDGTVHALVRFRIHRDVERTFRESGPGILAGGATLLAGFAALFVSDLPPVVHFAELATVTLGVATLAELTLLPALLHLFGRPTQSG